MFVDTFFASRLFGLNALLCEGLFSVWFAGVWVVSLLALVLLYGCLGGLASLVVGVICALKFCGCIWVLRLLVGFVLCVSGIPTMPP